MWSEPLRPYAESVGEGLILRTPSHLDDVERIAQFNASIHGAELAPMTRSLLLDYPGMTPQDCVFVENRDDEIVSSLCLIPWTWNCDGAKLAVGEMGIVGTAEEYRKRGLIRAQVGYFKQRLHERGCAGAVIQGIPYFYRQFGYEYALPLEGGYRLELRHVPVPEACGYRLRAGTAADIPALMSMYAEAVAPLSVHTERSEPIWRYLMTRDDPADAVYRETWIVERADGAAAGYCRIPRHHFGTELVLDEASASRYAPALAMLDHARNLAQQRNQPGIRLSLPASSPLVRIARTHGATNLGTYAWQLHIPDAARLLSALRPALQTRPVDVLRLDWCRVRELLYSWSGADLRTRTPAQRRGLLAARRCADSYAVRRLRTAGDGLSQRRRAS